MKTYPKVDWKPIDKYSRRKMDAYEEIIKSYLKHEEVKIGKDIFYSYPTDILAYNLAFLLLDEK